MATNFGLTHLALAVSDLDRSTQFYATALGMHEYYRDHDTIMMTGPDTSFIACTVASRGPSPSSAMTGMTKNVATVHARLASPPKIAATKRSTTRSSRPP